MTVKVTHPDNGYFEVVRFACGCERRITTEDIQWGGGLEGRRQHRRRSAAAAHRCGVAAREREQAIFAREERRIRDYDDGIIADDDR